MPSPHIAPASRALLSGGWRALQIAPADFYSSRDWPLVRRFGLALWILGSLLTALMLPFAPPVAKAPVALGWSVVALDLAIAGAFTWRLAARAQVSREELLAGSVFTVVGLGALAWLSNSQIYEVLLLLPTVYCATVHPPRRALAVLALALLVSAGLLNVTESASPAVEMIARMGLWLGLTVLAMGWSMAVRQERHELVRATESERARAVSDPLTGLSNRRAFDEALAIEMARAERAGTPLLLLSMDLDDFKRINDVHGHLAGDHVLRAAASVLAEHSRPPDAWFRWGGDEFTGLYPAARPADGEAISQRLIEQLAARCQRPDGTPLRAQIGAAGWRPGITGEELMATADAVVLAAKHERGLRRYDSRVAGSPER